MKWISYIVGMLCGCVLSVSAGDSCCPAPMGKATAAKETVQQMVGDVMVTLRDSEMEIETKRERVADRIAPVFDMELMAKLMLGRTGWSVLDSTQRDEFTDLCVQKLKKVYLGQLKDSKGEEVVFGEAALTRSGKALVETFVVSKSGKTSISYKMYFKAGIWKVYDVVVEDVSLVKSYNSQFASLVNSPEKLLQELRDSLND